MRASEHVIVDPHDERLVDFVGLRRPDRASAARGVVVCEGITVLTRLASAPAPPRIRCVVALPERAERVRALFAGRDVDIHVVGRDALRDVTGFDVHRGVLASVERPAVPDLEHVLDRLGTRSTVLVAVGLNDAENLGSIARTARALGVDLMVVDDRCADPYTRRTVRVSLGEVLFLPVARTTDVRGAFAALRTNGFVSVALTPALDAIDIADVADRGGQDRLALIIGAEGPGLDADVLAVADVRARVPMRSDADSINVGHATAAALAVLRRHH
jgi:tRNA G18 (ribose-2'-O)-methylase SpoU